jgi:hypothetical protein
MWGALSDERRAAIYNFCWTSPAQSFLGPSPGGLVTIFYRLRFETPPTWRARSQYLHPPGTGWLTYTPRYWIPFSLLPTTRRATVKVFQPASTWGWLVKPTKIRGKNLWCFLCCSRRDCLQGNCVITRLCNNRGAVFSVLHGPCRGNIRQVNSEASRHGLDSVEKEISCSARNWTRALQPVARRYINWSISIPILWLIAVNYKAMLFYMRSNLNVCVNTKATF